MTIFPHIHLLNSLTLRVFGCTIFVHVPFWHRGKLDLKSLKCVFIGYSLTQQRYKCYSPTLNDSTCLVMFSSLNIDPTIPLLFFRGKYLKKRSIGVRLYLFLLFLQILLHLLSLLFLLNLPMNMSKNCVQEGQKIMTLVLILLLIRLNILNLLISFLMSI